jgi:peroxiredoxin Q/BCP
MKVGEPIPNFSLPATDGSVVNSAALKGKITVLYFYPKDATPGCTRESQDFRDQAKAFEKLGAVIYGISRDSLASHQKFKAKESLSFELLSDEDEKACKLFGVLKPKEEGKETCGLERSTFLIDSKGILRREWRKVSVDDHVKAVLDAVKELHKT